MGVTAKIINKPELAAKLERMATTGAQKAMKSAMNYVKKHGPSEVARAVTKRYNIKQGEVKPDAGGGGSIKAGGSSLSFGGTTIADMTLTYVGRLLTPIHFNMSGSKPTKKGISRIKATILKGHRVQIGHQGPPYSEGGKHNRGTDSPYFLTANSKGGNQKTLPFQRPAGAAKPYKVFKTVSIPQMVSHESVGPVALQKLQEMAMKRLEHDMQYYLG